MNDPQLLPLTHDAHVLLRRGLIAVLLGVITALFAPKLLRSLRAPGALVQIHHLDGARYESAAIDPRQFTLRLEHSPGGLHLDLPGAMRMNGGIFEPDLRPTGLLIVDEVERHPIALGPGTGNFFIQPNGVFLITASGAAVVATDAFQRSGVIHATQSGPLLVQAGVINPALSPRSEHRFTRNGVGVRPDGTVVFAIARDEVTLHAFAEFFRDELECRDALYLDGAISAMATEGSRLDADAGPFSVVIRALRR